MLFNEITKKAIQEAIAHPRELDQDEVRLAAGAAHPRPAGGLPDQPAALEEGAARPLRRPGAVGRGAADRRARAGDQGVRPGGVLDARGRAGGQGRRRRSAPGWRRWTARRPRSPDRATADGAAGGAAEGRATRSPTVERRERRRNAPAPFITTKLQQEAANRLHFTAKKTMTLAQRLYEGVELGDEGQTALITYMRTDSVRLSDDAVKAGARRSSPSTYGKEYLPDEPVVYKTKKSAQDAHEAIRPVSLEYPPERVRPVPRAGHGVRLYELIWNRFVACQMKPAVYDQTTVDICRGPGHVPRRGLDPQVRRLPRGVRRWRRPPRRSRSGRRPAPTSAEATRRNVQLPELAEGDAAQARRAEASLRAALHPAAAPLHRGLAGEGAGGGRHRPALDLRVDPLGHPGQEVRGEARGPLPSHRAGEDHHRGAGEALPHGDGRHLHRRDGGEAGPDLRGRGRTGSTVLRDFYGPFQDDAGEGRAGDARRQARGDPHRRQLREVREA